MCNLSLTRHFVPYMLCISYLVQVWNDKTKEYTDFYGAKSMYNHKSYDPMTQGILKARMLKNDHLGEMKKGWEVDTLEK